MQHLGTIESLPKVSAMVKAMHADGLDWSEGYCPLGREALEAIIEGRLGEALMPISTPSIRWGARIGATASTGVTS